MNPTLKRILMILGLLLIAGVIGFALYSVFKKGREVAPLPPGVTGPGGVIEGLPGAGIRATTTIGGAATGPGVLPSAGVIISPANQSFYRPEAVTKLTTDPTLFPSITSGNVRFHNGNDGKFYSLGPDGKMRPMSDQVFFNVENVVWAKTVNKAVIEYPDNSKIVYNFDTKVQTTLPKHWEDFSFSPDGQQLAAKSLGLSPENRWLITTKDDGTGARLIEPLGNNADKVTMDWSPSRQTVAFSQTGEAQGADRKEILFLGLNGENFKSIVVEGLDFQSQWSPTGQKLLYSVDSARSDFKPELWVVNSYGDNIGSGRQLLQLNTWAKKCAFADDNTIVCGVPRSLPEGAGMSPEIAADTPDDLYRIDLKTGIRTPLPLDKDYTVDTISFDAVGRKFIFTDHHQAGSFQVAL